MANLYGVNVTKGYGAGTVEPTGRIDRAELNSNTRVLTETYAAAVDLGADSIFLGKLPKGAKIIRTNVYSADTGTTGAFTLGTADDADRFMVSQATTAGSAWYSTVMLDEILAETDLILAVTAGDIGSVDYKVVVEYVLV